MQKRVEKIKETCGKNSKMLIADGECLNETGLGVATMDRSFSFRGVKSNVGLRLFSSYCGRVGVMSEWLLVCGRSTLRT